MAKTILQVPLDTSLRRQSALAAQNLGFSSLQEIIRVFLKQLAAKEVTLSFEAPQVQLSKRAAHRYDKMIDDIESGRVKTKSFTSVDELMKDLNS
ncbi:MAG: hypothetical protein Q7R79_03890 [bacterium]|nr:hypothetical protein [bacterium]